MDASILQNPVSSPMAKHVESWLKTTDKAAGLTELSITGLVFMLERRVCAHEVR